MRLKLFTGVLMIATTLLTACETMTTSRQVAVSSNENWVILPVENLSKTPLAGSRAQSLVETHLRAQGVRNVDKYKPDAEANILSLLDEAGQIETAKQWAKDNGYIYGITGTVQEWQYKNGLDNEPSVALTLKFVHLQRDEVMWVASAARTGWGYNNIAGVASKTIAELMDEIHFKEPRRVTRIVSTQPAPQPITEPAAATTIAAPQPAPLAPAATQTAEPVAAAAKPLPEADATLQSINDEELLPTPYQTNLKETTNR